MAAQNGDVADVRRHLRWDATADQRDAVGMTPLMRAAGAGHLDVARLLVKNGADVNAKTKGEPEMNGLYPADICRASGPSGPSPKCWSPPART